MEEFNIQLGKRLRSLREKKGYSREILAEMANTSTNYLGEIERGEVNVSAIIVDRIAKSLNVSLSDVYTLGHVKNREILKKEIIQMLNLANDTEIEVIYKIVRNILK